MKNLKNRWADRSITTLRNDEGLTTVEYALGTLAAAALAVVLYTVVNSGAVADAFEDIIADALSARP
jgi:Flp pilus assembly pilin Flp